MIPRALQPLGTIYAGIGAVRRSLVSPWRAPVPVICVGNITVGGTGKTPTALALASLLKRRGYAVHLLSRGYGGHLSGPVAVDPARHEAAAVGDEALLLAEAAPTWIARDRVAGAKTASAAGADVLVLDDGFQNPALAKDLSLVVVDAGYGFGNGRVLPAGPLREPLAAGLARADAVVLMDGGDGERGVPSSPSGDKPILRARLEPIIHPVLRAGRVIAFAGIGRPDKFFAMLERHGLDVVARRGFPDHHAYTSDELACLGEVAEASKASLVTTRKDAVRLPKTRPGAASAAHRVFPIPVEVVWQDEEALGALLDRALSRGRHA